MRLRKLVVAAAVLACSGVVVAQTSQPGAATTQPARHALVVPPGFKVIEAGGRKVVAEAGDEEWIKKAMTELAPATRPTTAPADLVEKLKAARGELAKEMVADLALPDAAKVNAFLDQAVRTAEQFRDMRPPVYYLATTRAKLMAAVKGGWEDPRYYYNKAADGITVDTGMHLAVDGPMDDILLPALFPDDAKPDGRAAILIRVVQGTERMLADNVAWRAQVELQASMITFVIENVFRPMGLKTGQDWFGVGTSGVLSAKYASKVTGASEDWLLKQMTFESPRNPIKAASVDLLHPTDLNVLREQSVPIYLDAARRRSTAAVSYLLGKAGPGALPKVIAAMRKQLPPDGEGLVALIKAETGVDVSDQVRPATLP